MEEDDNGNKKLKLAEEAPNMSVGELNNVEKWIHFPLSILSDGRTSLYEAADMSEEQKAAFDEKVEKEKVDQFRVLAEDKPFVG